MNFFHPEIKKQLWINWEQLSQEVIKQMKLENSSTPWRTEETVEVWKMYLWT